MSDYSGDIEKFLNEIPTGKEDVFELYDEIKVETEKSYLLGDTGTTDNDQWFPKSQVEIRKLSNGYEVIVPYWLAKKKGMVD